MGARLKEALYCWVLQRHHCRLDHLYPQLPSKKLLAFQGKKDKLVGLKENVIVGRLIPAGTGGATQRVRRIATERDNVVIEARREQAQAAAALSAPDLGVFSEDENDDTLVDLKS